MKIVVWNSQGAKWDRAANYARLAQEPDEDLLLLLVEAGWAVWVQSQEVVVNGFYSLKTDKNYLDVKKIAKSIFCDFFNRRNSDGFWVPWMKTMEAIKTNTRCSIGGAFVPYKLRCIPNSYEIKEYTRPLLRLALGVSNSRRSTDVELTVFVVHMISGYPSKAAQHLRYAISGMRTLIPEGSAALIVGDMNIDILTSTRLDDLPEHWSVIRTGVATQQKGGELDFALLYDPNEVYSKSSVVVMEKFGTGGNKSDHSVLEYTIPMDL